MHGRMNPARRALALLLVINLLCYLDRYIIAAVVPDLKRAFLAGNANENGIAGLLNSAFIVSYMLTAPVFGWLAGRSRRWLIIGISVGLWSLASGASGFAVSFAMLMVTRMFVGIGEAGYGPAAPTIISDLFPIERRGRVMAWFFMAIPVGSALGYGFGGLVAAHWGWRWPFYLMTIPGLVLAACCFFMPEPHQTQTAGVAVHEKPTMKDYAHLVKIPSLLTNIAAQTAFTFAIGGLSFWVPTYFQESRGLPPSSTLMFGAILAATGLLGTLTGGWLGDRLRTRFGGAYFLVSGLGMLVGLPATLAMLYVPFPYAWVCAFVALFFLFLNTGPSNTALANVTPPALRASAFALNILCIHALGDVFSPALIGWIKDHHGWNAGFWAVSAMMLVAGLIWISSMPMLTRDTARMTEAEAAL